MEWKDTSWLVRSQERMFEIYGGYSMNKHCKKIKLNVLLLDYPTQNYTNAHSPPPHHHTHFFLKFAAASLA